MGGEVSSFEVTSRGTILVRNYNFEVYYELEDVTDKKLKFFEIEKEKIQTIDESGRTLIFSCGKRFPLLRIFVDEKEKEEILSKFDDDLKMKCRWYHSSFLSKLEEKFIASIPEVESSKYLSRIILKVGGEERRFQLLISFLNKKCRLSVSCVESEIVDLPLCANIDESVEKCYARLIPLINRRLNRGKSSQK